MTSTSSNLSERVARYQVVFGGIAVVVGIAAFVHARNVSFTASKGAALGWASYELTLMSYNRLGALVTVVLGLLGLAGGLTRHTKLGAVAAVGFAGIFLLGVVQVRPGGENLFGTSPQTMAFSLAMALGLAVTAVLTGPAVELDSAS